MNHKKKKITIFVVTLILICVCIFAYPSLYEYQCKNRYFEDFENKITNEILESNIVIVKQEKRVAENITSFSWDVGASGVVFDSEDNTYYALTAYHVVRDFENADYIIIPYGVPTYSEYSKNSKTHISNQMYYEQFEKAQLVFADEAYDLAVISFKSEKKLKVLPICEDNPKYNEAIMVISNPEGERFFHSYGNICSKDYYIFESNDELPPVSTFKHNAYESYGSSGSVVLNKKMEIVGINIGGGRDFMNRFKYGVMVPCELISEFLEKCNKNNTEQQTEVQVIK